MQIPGSNGNITGRFKYMKENGQITCTPEKLNTDVELAGNVSFTGGQSLKDYELRDGYFSAIGSAQIYEKSKSDGFALTSKIIKDASGTRLELIPGQNLPVAGSSSQKMKINYGKAVVNNTNTSWENLKFNTTLQGYQVVKKGEDQLDFEVKGAIALDPNGKKLQLDNIETPLGGLELSFDFAKKSFYGQLRLDVPIIIPPGLFTIYKGIAEVQLDGNGFIFTGSFSEAKFNPLDFLEEFQLGLAVGYYSSGIPEKMANNLKMITQQKQIPASLSQGLKGVYVSVSKGFSKGVDIPIIDMNIGISAGLDIRVIVNFNNTSKPDVYVDLFGKAEGHAYVGDEYRTGGEVNYVISAIVGFKNGKFQLLFEPGVAVKAVLLGKTIKDIEGHIIIGIDGSSFTFKPSFLMNKQKAIFILIFFVSISVIGNGQVIKPVSPKPSLPPFSLKYVGNNVFVQYRFSKSNSREKVNVVLYRGNEKNEGLKAIHQLNNLPLSTDYLYIDSTLPGRGVYQYTIEVISNGVALLRQSAMVYAYPVTLSPFVKSFDAKTKKGSNEVSLSWDVANSFLIRNIILLRSRKRDGEFKPLVTLKKDEKIYLDKVDEPNETFLQITNSQCCYR
ncbi:MAG: hypothetical protein WKF59_16665 [Chitinophagaceae bacterium]